MHNLCQGWDIQNRQYLKFVMFLSKSVEIDINFYMKKEFCKNNDDFLRILSQNLRAESDKGQKQLLYPPRTEVLKPVYGSPSLMQPWASKGSLQPLFGKNGEYQKNVALF